MFVGEAFAGNQHIVLFHVFILAAYVCYIEKGSIGFVEFFQASCANIP